MPILIPDLKGRLSCDANRMPLLHISTFPVLHPCPAGNICDTSGAILSRQYAFLGGWLQLSGFRLCVDVGKAFRIVALRFHLVRGAVLRERGGFSNVEKGSKDGDWGADLWRGMVSVWPLWGRILSVSKGVYKYYDKGVLDHDPVHEVYSIN
jgi:hypothetical protein